MATSIPTLTTIGPGKVRATPHNNNYTTIRDTVNANVPFLGAANAFTSTNSFAGLVTATAGLTLTGTLTMTTAASKVIPGATTFTLRDTGDANDNFQVADNGVGSIRSGWNIISGILQMQATASRLVPGATSFSVRNNANNADNFLVADAGGATVRNGLTVTAGGITVTAGTAALQAVTCTTLQPSSTVTLGNASLVSSATGSTYLIDCQGANPKIRLSTVNFSITNNAGSAIVTVDTTGVHHFADTFVGTESAMSTSANDGAGFLVLPSCAGAPTGTPTSAGGKIPCVYDTTNNKLMVRVPGGTWKGVTLA